MADIYVLATVGLIALFVTVDAADLENVGRDRGRQTEESDGGTSAPDVRRTEILPQGRKNYVQH